MRVVYILFSPFIYALRTIILLYPFRIIPYCCYLLLVLTIVIIIITISINNIITYMFSVCRTRIRKRTSKIARPINGVISRELWHETTECHTHVLHSLTCLIVIVVCSNNHYLSDYCDHYYYNNNVVTTVVALPPLTGHYTVGPACACAYRWGKNCLRRFESPVTSSSHRLLKDVAHPGCNALSRAPLSLPSPTHYVIYII